MTPIDQAKIEERVQDIVVKVLGILEPSAITFEQSTALLKLIHGSLEASMKEVARLKDELRKYRPYIPWPDTEYEKLKAENERLRKRLEWLQDRFECLCEGDKEDPCVRCGINTTLALHTEEPKGAAGPKGGE